MSSADTDSYHCPLNGQAVLRIAGRLRRLQLPLPPDPPLDDPQQCFFCRPAGDRLDQGPWGDELHVLGNAHPIGRCSLLLFPPGPGLHATGPSKMPARVVEALFSSAQDLEFRRRFGLDELVVCTFANVGRPSGQSRRHFHLQVVGYPPALCTSPGADRSAVQADLAQARTEGRLLHPTGVGGTPLVVPRHPGMSAELWMPLPPADRGARRSWVESLIQATAACESRISASYNLALREDLGILRLVPRGLCERAGLELSYPGPLDAVVGATVEESRALWRAALDA